MTASLSLAVMSRASCAPRCRSRTSLTATLLLPHALVPAACCQAACAFHVERHRDRLLLRCAFAHERINLRRDTRSARRWCLRARMRGPRVHHPRIPAVNRGELTPHHLTPLSHAFSHAYGTS